MSTLTKEAPSQNGHEIKVPEIGIKTVTIPIEGDSPLVCHRWSEKAKKMIRDKQTGKASNKKEPKDPEADYQASLYRMPDGCEAEFGFPSIGFKKAMVRAAKATDMAMTDARSAFFVEGIEDTELISIDHPDDQPTMREDMVVISRNTADIRYRGQFETWGAKLLIRYNVSLITAERIAHLVNLAGFGVGVGENRPEKDGQWGRFHVVPGDTEISG